MYLYTVLCKFHEIIFWTCLLFIGFRPTNQQLIKLVRAAYTNNARWVNLFIHCIAYARERLARNNDIKGASIDCRNMIEIVYILQTGAILSPWRVLYCLPYTFSFVSLLLLLLSFPRIFFFFYLPSILKSLLPRSNKCESFFFKLLNNYWFIYLYYFITLSTLNNSATFVVFSFRI